MWQAIAGKPFSTEGWSAAEQAALIEGMNTGTMEFDEEGRRLDGGTADYTITFHEGDLPPVNAFWSITMNDGKTQLLVANPINRYLINAPTLPDLSRNSDGSLTLYVQHAEPTDADRKANWLPAPDGPIYLVMRLYWPKEAALNGTWKPPFVRKAAN